MGLFDEHKTYRVAEVATILGVKSRQTILNWIKKGFPMKPNQNGRFVISGADANRNYQKFI